MVIWCLWVTKVLVRPKSRKMKSSLRFVTSIWIWKGTIVYKFLRSKCCKPNSSLAARSVYEPLTHICREDSVVNSPVLTNILEIQHLWHQPTRAHSSIMFGKHEREALQTLVWSCSSLSYSSDHLSCHSRPRISFVPTESQFSMRKKEASIKSLLQGTMGDISGAAETTSSAAARRREPHVPA